MLQNKDIIKTQEIKGLFKESCIQPNFLSKQLDRSFHFTKSKMVFNKAKNNGVDFWSH